MGNLNFIGEFKESGLEKSFQRDKWPSVRVRLLFLYFVTIAAYLFGVLNDFHALGSGAKFNILLMARGTVSLFGVSVFISLIVDRFKPSVQYATMALCMFAFVLVESLELIIKMPEIGIFGVPAAVFIVLGYYIMLPPKVLPSLFVGLSSSIIYLSSLSFVVPLNSGTFMNSALYFMLANTFGICFLATFGISLRREYAAMRDLKKLVEYDELTGVCSRRKVLEAGDTVFKSARRFNNKLSVLMMDIDNFKKVNDEYGHHVGDAVLKETARRCGDTLREVDFFGRLGGEEFVIVLPHSGLHDAIKVAERLRVRVREKMFSVDNAYLPVSVSIGAEEMGEHDSFLKLLQAADEQLYRAKKCGRNQVCPAVLRVIRQTHLAKTCVE